MVLIAWQLMMAVGLAASAGLRAFLPLLVVGGAARLQLIEVGARFQWMGSNAALTVLAVAVIVEVLSDKVPFVDHALDVVATMARPIAGAVVAAAPLTTLDPLTALVVGVILGGSVASGVHTAKSGLRLASTGMTAGLANPLVSVTEDAASLVGSIVSLLVPVVAFTLVLGVLYGFGRLLRQRSPAQRQV